MAAEGGRRRQKAAKGRQSSVPLPPVAALGLHVVVQEELVRMRPQRHGIDFLGALVREPGLDQVGREHSTLEQEGVVSLEGANDPVREARRVLTWLRFSGFTAAGPKRPPLDLR